MKPTLACERESRDLGRLDHLLMHQLGPRYLCLLRAESQGAHLQVNRSQQHELGSFTTASVKPTLACREERAVTWDALIICSCISLVHGDLYLLRAESQGAHLQLIDNSSIIGVIHHRFSEAKVARGIAETWDALIICSCISLVHGTFTCCGQNLRGFICS